MTDFVSTRRQATQAGQPPAPPLVIDAEVPLPLARAGDSPCSIVTFRGLPAGEEHFALRLGPAVATPTVRLHSECITGDVFGSERCDCGAQLDEAIRIVAAEGGFILYLRQEGRGIGLRAKLRAYQLQDGGMDTFQANRALGHPEDGRSYDAAVAMLAALGVTALTLLTNNPAKAGALSSAGLRVRVRNTGLFRTAHNDRYLGAKRQRGHSL